jgi:hypothetical protein
MKELKGSLSQYVDVKIQENKHMMIVFFGEF